MEASVRARAVKPRAFSLELTKACNLRCGYCYYAARENAYDPKTRMSPETARQSVDLLLREAAPGEPVHLHLFGGEPLLHFALVEEIVLYGEREAAQVGRAITFEITTNGTRLRDDVIAFLNAHAFYVGVSFDGPPDVQDAARPAGSGSSYAQAVDGIRKLLSSRRGTELATRTHCSVVITRRDLGLRRIVQHLEGLGFEKILLTPATDVGGAGVGLRVEDLPAVLAAYDDLAEDFERAASEGRRASVTWYPNLLGRLLSGEKRGHFCQGGLDYLGVAADGQVALCYRFYENPEFAMGNVATGIDRGVTERLLGLPVDQRRACSQCWARHFCGGGCHHENLISTGGLGEPNPVTCEILRHGMARTLEAYARLSRAGGIGERRPVERKEECAMEPRLELSALDRPRTRPSCFVREVGVERVVYEPISHEVVVLNATAHFIFALCDGTHTVQQIEDRLAQRFDAPRERLHADLASTLGLFAEKGLLAPPA